ncbi:hypothetical protein CPELA_02020 [Corynebacterium pelargi]|uniref:Uncharacterized protein n=1 Tax=Corynebacterium pelargi TaxID=1471400 RepID=A0A410W6V5_9CORY|nr:hypothetical protein CPELA_02020 [Corynebacterium pelargi]
MGFDGCTRLGRGGVEVEVWVEVLGAHDPGIGENAQRKNSLQLTLKQLMSNGAPLTHWIWLLLTVKEMF